MGNSLLYPLATSNLADQGENILDSSLRINKASLIENWEDNVRPTCCMHLLVVVVIIIKLSDALVTARY